ncbi:MAG: hypothetical protein FJ387_23675 [Verrucomicrobia bacterium]|nr:hypothetical protein [Verrucomicrobiota bacterium]
MKRILRQLRCKHVAALLAVLCAAGARAPTWRLDAIGWGMDAEGRRTLSLGLAVQDTAGAVPFPQPETFNPPPSRRRGLSGSNLGDPGQFALAIAWPPPSPRSADEGGAVALPSWSAAAAVALPPALPNSARASLPGPGRAAHPAHFGAGRGTALSASATARATSFDASQVGLFSLLPIGRSAEEAQGWSAAQVAALKSGRPRAGALLTRPSAHGSTAPLSPADLVGGGRLLSSSSAMFSLAGFEPARRQSLAWFSNVAVDDDEAAGSYGLPAFPNWVGYALPSLCEMNLPAPDVPDAGGGSPAAGSESGLGTLVWNSLGPLAGVPLADSRERNALSTEVSVDDLVLENINRPRSRSGRGVALTEEPALSLSALVNEIGGIPALVAHTSRVLRPAASTAAQRGAPLAWAVPILNAAPAIAPLVYPTGAAGPRSAPGIEILNGGTVVLTANDRFSGHALVAGGTLKNFGVMTDGVVTVAYGGTLGGRGSFASVNIEPGGTLAPGASPGTAAVDGGLLQLSGGGITEWELSDALGTQGANPGWDHINLINSAVVSLAQASSQNPHIIKILGRDPNTGGNDPGLVANWNKAQSYTWRFIGSTDDTGAALDFSPDKFSFDLTAFVDFNEISGHFSMYKVAVGAHDELYLQYTPNPEPAECAMMAAMGLLGFALWRRRIRPASGATPKSSAATAGAR